MRNYNRTATDTVRNNQLPPPPPPPPPSYSRKTSPPTSSSAGSFFTAIIVIAAFSMLVYTLFNKFAGTSDNGSKNGKKSLIAGKKDDKGVKKSDSKIKNLSVSIAPSLIKEDENIPPEQLVYVAQKGNLKAQRIDDAAKFGYSIIDLSDDFAPFIFTDGPDTPNKYRKTYLNLANDRTDEEGNQLKAGEHNYAELYGIIPSFGVIARRFVEDDSKECFKKLNYKYFTQANYHVTYVSRRDLRKEMETLKKEAARSKKKNSYAARRYRLITAKYYMVTEAQKRLKCEGLLASYSPGYINYSTIEAIKDFEHKHMIFGWGILSGDTRKGFGRTPLENNYRSLRRAVRERIVHNLGIIEDGSVNKVKGLSDEFKDHDGKTQRIPNLVKTYTDIFMREMGIETPEKALKFFKDLKGRPFERMKVAIKFPPLPDYYEKFNFNVVIDRGDVYYDAPFDASGKTRFQPVSRRPRIILYTTWKGQKVPLVRWGTTIGGWRSEFKDGKEYYAYKESDVGPRIWKDIFAAPVWIPPKSSPPSGLLRSYRNKDGRWITRVNREEIGPSYLSAYGLVAAHHIRNRSDSGKSIWFDNGIRTHGSMDYMSIMRRHSHGCHRLHNHLAVRLFSFILMHSDHKRKGQTKLIYTRSFNHKNKDYKIKLDTRGYQFSLTKPIEVEVIRGRVLGKLKQPFKGYLPKPGVEYDKDDPHLSGEVDSTDKSGGGQGAAETSLETKIKEKEEKRSEEKLIKSNRKLPPPPMGVKPIE